jgi:hypothetical protein
MRKIIKTESEKLDVLTHDYQGVEVSLIGAKKDGEIFQLIINDEEVISGEKLHAIADVILQFFGEMGDIEFVKNKKEARK